MVDRVGVRRSLLALFAAIVCVVGSPLPAGAAAHWTMQSRPDQGTNSSFLYDVACTTARSCAAVGFFTAPGVDKTLIESWNGDDWKIVPSPSPGGVWNFLYDVACVGPKSCVAVGRYENQSGVNRTLIESWNGTAWKVVPSPNNGSGHNILNGVSCVTAKFCVAVGSAQTGSVNRTLIESWNGTAWKVVPSPIRGTVGNTLAAVACTSSTSCVAAGSNKGVHGVDRTLVESWNGTAWKIVNSSNNGPTGNTLTGLSCPSAAACMAVGAAGTGAGGVRQTLALFWDGSGWKLVTSPNRGTNVNVLSRVACTSAGQCQAVGWSQDKASGPRRTLVEAWKGTKWSLSSSPNPVVGAKKDAYLGVTGSALNGVSCVTTSLCFAAGFHVKTDGIDETLTERYR